MGRAGARDLSLMISWPRRAQASRQSVEPASDWPYVYIDDAADAADCRMFLGRRRQLLYFIAYPEQVTLEQTSPRLRLHGGRAVPLCCTSRPTRPRVHRGVRST